MNTNSYIINRYHLIWMGVIVVLAAILRLTWLSRYPVSLNVDEVAIGYDAFSILKSGKDMHGKSWPTVFESLGDYKPGLYIYLVAFSELVFGVNEVAVRIPSAIAGIFTVLVLFFLISELTNNQRLAVISSLVLALSPWHIRMSRGATEANLALFLLISGYWLTLRAIRFRSKFNFGVFFLALSTYAYHSEKVIAPLLYFSTIWIFYKSAHKTKEWITWTIVFLVLLVPFFKTLDSRNQSRLSAKTINKDVEIQMVTSRADGNKVIVNTLLTANTITKRYFEYFDFGYVLNKGLNLTNSSNLDLGWFYWLELPFLLYGVGLILKNKEAIFIDKERAQSALSWLVLSPIPASITMDSYHPFRLLSMVVVYVFVIAIGIDKFIDLAKARRYLTFKAIFLVYFISFAYFVDYFMIQYPKDKSHWQFDPSKEVALTALKNQERFDKIVIDPNFGKTGPNIVGVPDLYILFYGQITPKIFRESITNNGFGKFEFRKIDWNIEQKNKKTLLIGSTWSLPIDDLRDRIEKEIKFYNGETAYLAVKTD